MQSFVPAFEEAGVSVFVVFPEPVEQLNKFAEEYNITLPLLSDPDSAVIREVGILNTTLTEADAPFYGIPFPGSYVIGVDGRVVEKFFEQNSLIRAHPELLLRAATGQEIAIEEMPTSSGAKVEEVQVEVVLDADELPAFLLRDLVVTLRVPAGQHLYGPPVTEGLVVTSVALNDSKHLGSQAPQYPPTHPIVLSGTGETLQIYEGDVQIRVPILFNGFPPKPDADGSVLVEVAGTVAWQSCDDHSCHIPRSEQFSLMVRVRAPNGPGRMAKAKAVPDESS